MKVVHDCIIVSVIRLSNLDDGFLYDFLIVFNVVFDSERSVGLESMVISREFL